MTVEANSRPPIHQRSDGIGFGAVAIDKRLSVNLTASGTIARARCADAARKGVRSYTTIPCTIIEDCSATPGLAATKNPDPDRSLHWDVFLESTPEPSD